MSEEEVKRLLDQAISVGTAREQRVIVYHEAIVRAVALIESGRVEAAVKVLRETIKLKSAT